MYQITASIYHGWCFYLQYCSSCLFPVSPIEQPSFHNLVRSTPKPRLYRSWSRVQGGQRPAVLNVEWRAPTPQTQISLCFEVFFHSQERTIANERKVKRSELRSGRVTSIFSSLRFAVFAFIILLQILPHCFGHATKMQTQFMSHPAST